MQKLLLFGSSADARRGGNHGRKWRRLHGHGGHPLKSKLYQGWNGYDKTVRPFPESGNPILPCQIV